MECGDFEGFSDVARDHAMSPRNFGSMKSFDGHSRITGPCGDTMEFWLIVRDGTVRQASFITDGCGSSRAAGSMATSLAGGKKIEEAAAIGQFDILAALGKFPREVEHCALLAANTLKAACEDCLKRKDEKVKDAVSNEEREEQRKLDTCLSNIRHKIVVLSGKGGVGKSTVAVNLAVSLMLSGKRVGLLDVDIHGPSIPTMLGLEDEIISGCEGALVPVELGDLKVMSLGFMLRDPDQPVIWRGPMKTGVIKQFLTDVMWGDLDFLVIDCPPGTGDEPLSICQLISSLDGAVVVTTPQKVAARDVRKCVAFCRELHVPILGIVENMSGFVCSACGHTTEIFCSGAGRQIAEDMGLPFLGSIPIDPAIAGASDNGKAYVHHYAESPVAALMKESFHPIVMLDEGGSC